jgi:hypothetical protein
MTQTVTDEDGTVHQFPDDATQEEMSAALRGGPPATPPSQAGSGQGIIPGSPQAIAQNQAANVSQPQIDPSHFTVSGSIGDTLRSLNQGLSGGLWNPVVAGTKSLITGAPYSDALAAEQQKSSEAMQVSPGSNLAEEGLGAVVGPGKFSKVESAAQQAPGFFSRLLTRLGGGAAEGSTYAGVNAAANQQPVIPAMEKGAAFGGAGAAAMPVAIKGAGKVWNMLPGAGGDLPVPLTSAELTDPRRGGGYSFVSNADKATAAKLAPLESMQYNASLPSSRPLPSQVSELLDKNITTQQSMADTMGYTKDEQDALAQVGKTTPVSTFFVKHPRVAQGTISAVGELPATLMGLHGNLAESAATEAGSIAGHVAAATLPYKMANQGAQDALDQAKRIIAGQPTTTDRWNAVNDPRVGQALQSILFGQTLQQ